jgi:hypothetical protein
MISAEVIESLKVYENIETPSHFYRFTSESWPSLIDSKSGIPLNQLTSLVRARRTIMDLSEYALEPLPNKDEEFALHRGHARRPETSSVLLLTPVSSRPARESLKKLEHEYWLRSELDAAWVVRPLELSQDNDQRVLVLEDRVQ